MNEGQVETSTSLTPPFAPREWWKAQTQRYTSRDDIILKFQASQLKQSLEEKMLI